MTKYKIYLLVIIVCSPISYADAINFNQLYKSWINTRTVKPDANQGKKLWILKGISGKSCASCHATNLKTTGAHVKTNKKIKPMSPRVNPQRLSSVKKINKWLKRNCKFTYKRECSAQEKIDFIEFIRRN